jgi:hypothetical protein
MHLHFDSQPSTILPENMGAERPLGGGQPEISLRVNSSKTPLEE